MKLQIAAVTLSFAGHLAAANIPASAAKDHLNESATVCGKVVATRYLDQSATKITFLNFDKPYPETSFTAVIQGENRAKFGEPEKVYLNKDLCVTGKIEEFDWPARKKYDEFDFGYVLTVHKSQGSQWDDVVLFDESFAFPDSRARWLYTGITRAAKRLTIVM